MRLLWGDKNLSFHDGTLPIAQIAATEELESVGLTFVPGADDVAAFNDQVLGAHPDCALRLYRLPAGTDLAVLGGLTRIKRLKLEVEPASLDFLASLGALVRFHGMLQRGANAAAVPWPGSMRHLSLVAHALAALEGLPALRSLELAAKVGDLGFLAGCPKLTSLALDGRSTGDLSALARCAFLAHVRVNGQAKVEASHLAPLAQMKALRFVQLMYLPRIADVGWLGERPRHLELTAMKGLRSVIWPGLAHADSFALYPPFGKVSEIDLTVLLTTKSLKRVSLAPLLSKAGGGRAVLEALKPLHTDIQTFRDAVNAELGLDGSNDRGAA